MLDVCQLVHQVVACCMPVLPSPPLCPAAISTADAYGYDVQYLKGSANTYVDEKKGTTSGHVNVKAYGTPHKPASVGLSATSCIGEHCKEKKEEQEP
jgi:hypothetical protein